MTTTIGKNLKHFREVNGFTQENAARFLNIERGTLSNYELDTREAPMEILIKLSNLYGVDLSDILEEDEEKVKGAMLCAFRLEGVSCEDMRAIASFKDIVKSYLKMKTLE